MLVQFIIGKTYYCIKSDNIEQVLQTLKPMIRSLKKYRYDYNKRYRKVFPVLERVYYYHDLRDNVLYFPISTIAQCMSYFRSQFMDPKPEQLMFLSDSPIYSFTAEMKDTYQLRDYQKQYLDIVTKRHGYYLIDLKPGSGKTFIAVNAIVKLGVRTGIVVLPKYMDKWRDDVKKYTHIPDDKIYMVQGSDSLYQLLKEKDPSYQVIIFSLRTLYLLYGKYENGEDIGIKPWEVFNQLKIGMLLSDESHQELDALFKVVMYSNVKTILGLSGTYMSNNKFEDHVQHMLFPENARVSNLVPKQAYIHVYAVGYEIPRTVKIKDSNGQGYSHIAFEQSLLKNEVLFENYLEMVNFYVDEGYITKRKPKEKCLVFFSTIEACNKALSYLKKKYPKLKITRNVGEDDYHEMLKGDIIITTPGSSGTAIDFPNLICVVNTVSIGSVKSNIQIAGRLRFIKGRPLSYYYTFCKDNRRQRNLHKVRKHCINHMAKVYKTIDYLKSIIPYRLKGQSYKFS